STGAGTQSLTRIHGVSSLTTSQVPQPTGTATMVARRLRSRSKRKKTVGKAMGLIPAFRLLRRAQQNARWAFVIAGWGLVSVSGIPWRAPPHIKKSLSALSVPDKKFLADPKGRGGRRTGRASGGSD